jgi:hypothetical protein
VSNVIINPFRPTNLGTGQEVEASCSTRRLARFVDKKAGSLRDECEQAPALADLHVSLRHVGADRPPRSCGVSVASGCMACGFPQHPVPWGSLARSGSARVKPGDGGKHCAAVFQGSRRWFLTIDTRADSFVTSVRINNVIFRRISRAVGRFAQRGGWNAFSLASSQFIASPFEAGFSSPFSSRWDKLRAAGLQRSCVVYECYDQERIVAYG